MFEKNDKPLFTFRTIIKVLLIIFVIAGIVLGLFFWIYYENLLLGLIFLLGIPFLSWLMWIVEGLFITYLCDIKLVRNKLYGVSNDNLKVFLEEQAAADFSRTQQPASAANDSSENETEQLFRLKRLLDNGAITQEEFDREKKKYLK